MKLNRLSKLVALLVAAVFVFTFVSCADHEPISAPDSSGTPEKSDAVQPTASFVLKDIGTFDFHTDLQKGLIEDGYISVLMYASGDEELSRPDPVRLQWKCESDEQSLLLQYLVYISEDPEFFDTKPFITTNRFCDVYNLKLDTVYYWKVKAMYEKNVFESGTASFSVVSQAPRNLYIDGITNVRDLGGWLIERDDGSVLRTRQGMIYRCGRLTANGCDVPEISYAGIDEMVNRLGIRTEIDLRDAAADENGGITESVLGESVRYYSCSMTYDKGLLVPNSESIRRLFRILSDETNYPLCFHCSIGTDRTGLIAYMINGLLGLDEDSLYLDYVFSDLADIGGPRTIGNITGTYVNHFNNKVKGGTLSERIRNYLLSIGVTEEELDSLVRIMTEAKK